MAKVIELNKKEESKEIILIANKSFFDIGKNFEKNKEYKVQLNSYYEQRINSGYFIIKQD